MSAKLFLSIDDQVRLSKQRGLSCDRVENVGVRVTP